MLLPSAYQNDLNRARSRIQSIQTSGATEIFQGLNAGFQELRRSLDPSRGNHLILLTDGHTYGDEQACLQLAEEAASMNISISGFGIGGDWNDIFLDSLVSRTGGNSTYVAEPQDIQTLLLQKFAALARSLVDDAVLEFRASGRNGDPQLPPSAARRRTGGDHRGATPRAHPARRGVERAVRVRDRAGGLQAGKRDPAGRHFAPGGRRTSHSVPSTAPAHGTPSTDSPSQEPPPQSIIAALSRLSLYRLQERARSETEAGEYASATRHLRNLALQLQAQGQHDLSKTTLFEAETIERLQAFSEQGQKQVKYGTRALLRPGSGGIG